MSQVAARHPLLSSPEHVKHLHKLIEGNMWWRWVEVFKRFNFWECDNRCERAQFRIESSKSEVEELRVVKYDTLAGMKQMVLVGGLLGLGIVVSPKYFDCLVGLKWGHVGWWICSYPFPPLESLICLIRQSKGAQQKTVKSLEFHFRALNGRCRGPGKLR